MKRVLSSIIVASVMLSIMVPFVSANETQEPTNTTAKPVINRPVFEKMKEDRWQIIQNFYHAMKERFDFAAKRLGEIADNMQKKADEFESKGADTAAVEQKIADAKSSLADANALVAKATEQFKAIHDATDRKAAFAEFRATVGKVREALKAAHMALKDAAHGLRDVYKSLVGEKKPTENNQ